jgi:hypothetical protein
MVPRPTTADVVRRLRDAIDARRGLSLVRLGDGEGRVLGYPKLVDWELLDRESLVFWFGRGHGVVERDILDIGTQLRAAIRAADLVGLPRAKQVQDWPEWRRVVEVCEEESLLSPESTVVDTAMHHYLQFARAYQALLAGRPFVGLITGRDVAGAIGAGFSIPRVDQYLVPAESGHAGPRSGRHYPDRFNEIRATLEVPYPGAVFLIGAGVLGKIYCHWIQQRGGIAIDIGSMFDVWSEVRSRARFRSFPEQFRLAEPDPQPLTDELIEARVGEARRLIGIP